MARAMKVFCMYCEAKMEAGVSFCPSCTRPTEWASHDERIQFELKEWRSKRSESNGKGAAVHAPSPPPPRRRAPVAQTPAGPTVTRVGDLAVRRDASPNGGNGSDERKGLFSTWRKRTKGPSEDVLPRVTPEPVARASAPARAVESPAPAPPARTSVPQVPDRQAQAAQAPASQAQAPRPAPIRPASASPVTPPSSAGATPPGAASREAAPQPVAPQPEEAVSDGSWSRLLSRGPSPTATAGSQRTPAPMPVAESKPEADRASTSSQAGATVEEIAPRSNPSSERARTDEEPPRERPLVMAASAEAPVEKKAAAKKKAPVKKKTTAKKPAKKKTARKASAKKTTAKKPAAKKPTTRKTPAKQPVSIAAPQPVSDAPAPVPAAAPQNGAVDAELLRETLEVLRALGKQMGSLNERISGIEARLAAEPKRRGLFRRS